jgi:hypothetical protein
VVASDAPTATVAIPATSRRITAGAGTLTPLLDVDRSVHNNPTDHRVNFGNTQVTGRARANTDMAPGVCRIRGDVWMARGGVSGRWGVVHL